MNLTKWQVYTIFSVSSVFVLVALLLSRWQISVTVEQTQPQLSPVSLSNRDSAVIESVANNQSTTKVNPRATSVKTPPRALRLSNQTDYPVRVAFLPKQVGARKQESATVKQSVYGEPGHWDFAPQEGASTGLVLSLPKGIVQLENGDVLVAFAQDGSGRYWGPYVVGETSSPVWNRQKSEWQLILQP
ncbi:hypothetical protein ACE1CI_36075 [Aerosakkonemataceae cyanobacterium BLCC-F50]|uniref:Uncharacterized protein n=1 Tax=Floridaenema flaviceps BLCC-F50 TaxID=3153642 RepID=A0ABV4Y504_9CYAN